MPHIELSKNIYDCSICETRCDGKSKRNYDFKSDVEFAEAEEQFVIEIINENLSYQAQKCEKAGYPDIEIFNLEGDLVSYLEIKAQRRTFMIVEKLLPQGDLKPSETVVLNLSDLLRYFEIEAETQVQTSILWVLSNRPCINGNTEKLYYYQRTKKLKDIYSKYGDLRRFKRKSGKGDVVNGIHKGVVVNYHFSLNELELWQPK